MPLKRHLISKSNVKDSKNRESQSLKNKFEPNNDASKCMNEEMNEWSQLIDLILRPLIAQIPSYLKDSYDVIRMIDAEWRPLLNNRSGNYTLYTWDIKEFYPSLNYIIVKKSVLFWFDRHPSLIVPRFAKSFIVGALHIIMTRSNCKFDDNFFQFEKSLPTGTAAVTLAVLVQGYLMESLYTYSSQIWPCSTTLCYQTSTSVHRWQHFIME